MQRSGKDNIMLLLVWVECSVSFLFMKACKVKARAPHKPRCHLQSSLQVIQCVKLATSHVYCLSESSLIWWRLGPSFWKCKLINKHPKLVICRVLLPWTTSPQTKSHMNTSISWEIQNPLILMHLFQMGPSFLHQLFRLLFSSEFIHQQAEGVI